MTVEKKKPNKARINYFVDIIIAVSFVLVAVSGMILFFGGSGGYQGGRNPHYGSEILGFSRLLWKDLHDWGGIVMLGGVFLHLVLHWKWIVCMTRNLLRGRAKDNPAPGAARGKPVGLPVVESCTLEG
jgi:cytochrome b subunit of formate dehydrogenase